MGKYKVVYEDKAVKQLRKMDASARKVIRSWIEKNLIGTSDPRMHGKALSGDRQGYWRYRIGDYRIIAEIRDREFIIVAISMAHRNKVYR